LTRKFSNFLGQSVFASVVHIFVVDADPNVANGLARILRLNGFPALSFVNPFEAIEAAGLQPPALLIADVRMQKLSGIELGVRLKSVREDCEVLMMSGDAGYAGTVERARLLGLEVPFLLKPVVPLALIREVKKLLPQGEAAGMQVRRAVVPEWAPDTSSRDRRCS
jgi:DNA-binding NtrC family response regulator